jgi:hypothetical protein
MVDVGQKRAGGCQGQRERIERGRPRCGATLTRAVKSTTTRDSAITTLFLPIPIRVSIYQARTVVPSAADTTRWRASNREHAESHDARRI